MISTMRWTASAADALWCSCAPQSRIQPRTAQYLWHQNAPPRTGPAKQEAMPPKAWFLTLSRVQGGSACRESKGQRPWPSEVLKAQRPQGGSTLRTGYYLPKITGGTGKRNPPKQREGIPVPESTTKNERRHRLSQEKIPAYPATTDAPASAASTTPNTMTAAST